jgi:hypothetical protein
MANKCRLKRSEKLKAKQMKKYQDNHLAMFSIRRTSTQKRPKEKEKGREKECAMYKLIYATPLSDN